MSPANLYEIAPGPPPKTCVEEVGNKAWNLMRMAAAGLRVPAGFVLPASWSKRAHENVARDAALTDALSVGIGRLEKLTGLGFGSSRKPLLVSVRSGSAISMPGGDRSRCRIESGFRGGADSLHGQSEARLGLLPPADPRLCRGGQRAPGWAIRGTCCTSSDCGRCGKRSRSGFQVSSPTHARDDRPFSRSGGRGFSSRPARTIAQHRRCRISLLGCR